MRINKMGFEPLKKLTNFNKSDFQQFFNFKLLQI